MPSTGLGAFSFGSTPDPGQPGTERYSQKGPGGQPDRECVGSEQELDDDRSSHG